jgi:hypothetical protein
MEAVIHRMIVVAEAGELVARFLLLAVLLILAKSRQRPVAGVEVQRYLEPVVAVVPVRVKW